jgi:hypothetical protein
MTTDLAFFSYARKDSEFVLRLASELKAGGANVWLDQLDIAAGTRWDRAVEEALAHSKTLIIVLSPASVASQNVLDEVAYALDEQKTLIPILYRECTIPLRLRRFQYLDFRADHDRIRGLLISALVGDQAGQAPLAAAHPPTPAEERPHEERDARRRRVRLPPTTRLLPNRRPLSGRKPRSKSWPERTECRSRHRPLSGGSSAPWPS